MKAPHLLSIGLFTLVFASSAHADNRNLAKYQKAVGSTWGYTLRPHLFATDGIASNFHRWRSSKTTGQWLEIHYPRPVTIASAHLYTGVISSTTDENWVNFKLQYDNAGTWVDIPGGSRSGNSAVEVNVIFSQAVTSDKFRLLSTDTGSAVRSIREIAMFGPNVVSSVEQGYPIGTGVVLNLAHKRPATASSINTTNFAIKAVDGYVDDSSRWLCATGTTGQTLEIDLLSVDLDGDWRHAIGSAHLYSGDIATSSGALSDFTLESWDTVTSTWVAIPGATITGNTSTARVIPFSSNVVTTKVRLVNNTTTSAKVAELLIFPPRTGGYPLGQDVKIKAPPTAKAEDFSDATRHLRVSSASLKLGLVSGNAVFTNDAAGSDALNWQVLLNHRDGSYRIRHIKTGQCLALAQLSTAPNTLVIGETYTGMPHQCWILESVNATQFRLLNAYSGLALQSLGGSTTPGTALAVVAPGSSTLQQWDTVWQTYHPKKGIAGSGNTVFFDTSHTWMSLLNEKFQHTSWSYSWGREDVFPYFGINQTFNPMQWGNFRWAHEGTNAPLEGDRNYMQSQAKPLSLLGFNEPDGTQQANMTVAQAIARWPRLESMDAPLVGPCPANPQANAQGFNWNAEFHAAVNELGYRVDYTPLHWYGNPNASSLINKIKELYTAYGRPIWLTEFSPVFWSGTSTWTHASNYNFLAEFLWRGENMPELARHSIFCFMYDPATDPPNAPRGNTLDENGNLTNYGALYASWDGVTQVLTQKAYHLHNRGHYQRMQSPASGDSFSFVTPDNSSAGTQWFLVPGTTANTYRIKTTRDGRPLSRTSGNPAAMGAPGQVDTATEWTLVPVVSGVDHDGWYYLQHPLTNQRLKNNGNGTCSMVATSDVTNESKWRFIVPLAPDGGSTPPTLAASDITDNQPGGTVSKNTPVTYTLTFSEDIDASSVTASDFGNSGTAAITIGTITETSPGVITVTVTPTTGGTLIFRVNAGAVITDVIGTPIDTTAAIVDATTITVPVTAAAVIYNGNGNTSGSVPVDNNTYPPGSTVTVLGNTGSLTKTGNSFAGWNTADNGGGTPFAPAATFTISNDTTLYAQWTPNSYTVTFNANQGNTPSPTSKSVTYNATYGTLATVSRTGFAFNGWFTDASGGTQVTDATLVTSAAHHSLFAQWTAIYTVSYSGNGNTGGTAPANQDKLQGVDLPLATNSGNLTKTDFSFFGWNTASNGSGTDYPAGSTYTANAAITLYAKWVSGVDGTWLPTTAGPFNWGDGANWSGGNIASGSDATALFTPNIAAAQVANLEVPRTIGNITFTDSTTNSHNLTISGANILTLSRSSGAPLIDVTQSTRTLTISSQISGSRGLQKNGAGTLTLSGTNDYTGGTILNGGTLATTSDANLGSSGGITVNNTSTWSLSPGTYDRALTINNDAALTVAGANGAKTITGVLSGTGTLLNGTTTTYEFSNPDNTFTGTVNSGYGMYFASIGDSSNPFNLVRASNAGGHFYWTGGEKIFALRPLTLDNTNNGTFHNNGSGAVTIQQALAISGTAGARTLGLNGTYTGAPNTFSGIIADGVGSVVGLSKSGNGTWQLANTNNSYTGLTSVTGGTLSILSIANFGSPSSIGESASGAIVLGSAGTTGTLLYTGDGDESNRTVQVNSSVNTNSGGAAIINNGTGALTFMANPFNDAYVNASASTRMLTFGGTNGGAINGVIQDNSATSLVGIGKTGTGTWILKNTNTNTGASSVTGGGNLILDYTSTHSKFSDAAVLTLGGGTITLKGGAHTEIVGNTALATGASFITRDGGTSVLQMNGLTRTGAGTIRFLDGTVATTDTANFNGILGGHATIGNDWAINSTNGADGPITALSSGSYTGALPTTGGVNTANYTLSGGQLQTGTATLVANTVKLEGTGEADNTLALGATNINLTVGSNPGGILYVGGGTGIYNITADAGKGITIDTHNRDLIITTVTGTLNISAKINSASARGLIKSGAGTLVLSSSENVYTRTTYVNEGTLALVGGSLASPIIVASGASLGFTIGSPTTSTSSVDFGAGTVTITGTPTLASYTLMTASGGFTGTPVLSSPVPGCTLIVEGTQLKLLNTQTNSAPVWSNNPITGSNATENVVYSGSISSSATDANNNPLTFAKVSGPAWLSIAANGTLSGTPTPSNVGANAFTVSVSDGIVAPVVATLNITVITVYGIWSTAEGLTGDDALPGADPDGDSLTNFMEFALGMDPAVGSPGQMEFLSGGEVTKPGVPVLKAYTPPQGSPPFQAVFGRRKNHIAAGLVYSVEFSANLAYWSASDDGLAVLPSEGNQVIEVVSVPFPANVPLSEGDPDQLPPKFFRLNVSNAQP